MSWKHNYQAFQTIFMKKFTKNLQSHNFDDDMLINKLEQNNIYYVFFIRGKICPNQEKVLLFSATSSLESVA